MRRTVAPPAPPLRLALLLYPGCMPAGLFATADLARAANLRAQRPVITTCWAGADLQPVPTSRPRPHPLALAQAEWLMLCPDCGVFAHCCSAAQHSTSPRHRRHCGPPLRTRCDYCAGVALLRPSPFAAQRHGHLGCVTPAQHLAGALRFDSPCEYAPSHRAGAKAIASDVHAL